MYPRVTAVIVAHNGAAHLARTLDALRAQTRQPDAVVAVDGRSRDSTAELLSAFGPTQLIQVSEPLSFGQAVARAVKVIPAPSGDHEWLWLLSQDSAPEPGALAALLGAVEVAPSVAVAGPKQMDWLRPDHIRGYGESLSTFGSTVALVEDELDQGQHDGETDVLAVAAGGLLVRHTLWNELGGFDPGLPVVDDALDFCVRTRLAGHRVVRVPDARVSTARIGLQGPDGRRINRGERRRARQKRAAQLHRRFVYSPAVMMPLHWIALLPVTIGRAVLRLLRKQPGLVGGEILAALVVAFGGTKILRARTALKSTRKAGWKTLASLRISVDNVRQLRSTRFDAVRTSSGREYHPVHFFSRGGVWVVLAAAVASLAIFTPLLASPAIGGGGLLPLSSRVGELWENAAYGWRDLGVGFIGAADPFSAVLALLGSLTFWAPSLSLVILFLAAIPLSAMGAWFLAARLTGRPTVRALAALVWAVSPPLLTALSDARPSAVITHVLLPWLFFAGFGAARSWSASGAASILAVGVVASSPVLAPALLLVWIVVLATSGRQAGRFVALPIPTLALFLPLVIAHGMTGDWIRLLADPGVPVASPVVEWFRLATGLPGASASTLVDAVVALGLPAGVADFAPLVLIIPIAALVIGSLAVRANLPVLGGVGLIVLGYLTATASQQLLLTTTGPTPVSVWAGSGLSLFWLGAIVCAVIGLSRMPRIRFVPVVAAAVAAVLLAIPLAAIFPAGEAALRTSTERAVPAYVSAEAATDPRLGTLVIVPQVDGSIVARLERDQGETLDAQSTLVTTGDRIDDTLVELAGNLASRSGLDVSAELDRLGIRFVVLAAAATAEDGTTPSVSTAVRSRAEVALDANPAITPVGDTQFGLLWSHDAGDGALITTPVPEDVVGPVGRLYQIGLLIVFAVAILLALPTGLSLERSRNAGPVPGIDDEPTEATGQYDDGDDNV